MAFVAVSPDCAFNGHRFLWHIFSSLWQIIGSYLTSSIPGDIRALIEMIPAYCCDRNLLHPILERSLLFFFCNFCNFMVTKRFSRTDSTENQSCSQLLRRCTYQVTFRLPSCLTTTLLTCQLILLLANHSACFSRNFIAMNFIVKSTIINVSSLFKVSTICRLYRSWFSARRIFPISLCTQK